MFSIQQWEEIVNQYQCFNGTINQFCQTKGITKAQLYYYRKKFNNQNQDSTEFCQVTLESTKVTKFYPDTNVTFEIGENQEKVPKYCYNCGKMYPWTKSKLQALNEVIDLADELEDDDKNELKEASELISTDTPRTQVGVLKIKKYTDKIGGAIGEKLQDLIVDIASETAIKSMKEIGMLPK